MDSLLICDKRNQQRQGEQKALRGQQSPESPFETACTGFREVDLVQSEHGSHFKLPLRIVRWVNVCERGFEEEGDFEVSSLVGKGAEGVESISASVA